jgi:hypothetical protein
MICQFSFFYLFVRSTLHCCKQSWKPIYSIYPTLFIILKKYREGTFGAEKAPFSLILKVCFWVCFRYWRCFCYLMRSSNSLKKIPLPPHTQWAKNVNFLQKYKSFMFIVWFIHYNLLLIWIKLILVEPPANKCLLTL